MEAIWNDLQMSHILWIMGVALLGNLLLMGLIYILFKMFFPLIKTENSSPQIKKRIIRRDSQGSKPIRVRKMRLAQ